jgi:hypothetical protein
MSYSITARPTLLQVLNDDIGSEYLAGAHICSNIIQTREGMGNAGGDL